MRPVTRSAAARRENARRIAGLIDRESTEALAHPCSMRGRDTLRVFRPDPAMNVLPPGVPVGGRIGTVANWIHGSELSTAEIDHMR
jgi:hypothetical protein